MIKDLVLRLFIEARIIEDEEPLDFGEPVADTIIPDTSSEPAAPAPTSKPKSYFLGQPVASEHVKKILGEYMNNIRGLIRKDFFDSVNSKSIKQAMKHFATNIFSKRKGTIYAPNVDLKLLDGTNPEKYIAFLQEWAYKLYLQTIVKKWPAITWTKERIDIKDPKYASELLGGIFWKNLQAKIFKNPEFQELYYVFRDIVNNEKQRRKKERERSILRRQQSTQTLDEVNQKVMSRFKKHYGDKEGERIYYATANKHGHDPETYIKND